MSYRDVISIAAAFDDVNDIKTSVATSTSIATYTGTALNGRIGQSSFLEVSPYCLRSLTVTTTAIASCYNVNDAIQFIGVDKNGNERAAPVNLTQLGGGETVQTVGYLARVTSIIVPAQLLATGAFEFGVGDLVFDPPATLITATGAGVYYLQTGAGYGVTREITMVANEAAELEIHRVLRAQAVVPFNLYFPPLA